MPETMTEIEKIVTARIKAGGSMPIAEYMALCLGHPDYGYYSSRDPFGEKGDFTTAPEISQIFGELIGAWCMQVWHDMEEPERFHLVELGPGRGSLMDDILRICTKNEAFAAAARIHLVETSPFLIRKQQEKLQGYDINWHKDFNAIEINAPLILVANELLDALPIHQFICRQDHWHERAIGLDDSGGLSLIETAPGFDPRLACMGKTAQNGDILELCPVAQNLLRDVTSTIMAQKGAALFIDYGHMHSDFGDTLQAVRGHKYVDILQDPGECDMTAHVDFQRLYDIAVSGGAAVQPVVSQGEFLKNLGIELRAEMLKAQNADMTETIETALSRLISDNGMGKLFKVLGISHPSLNIAGFENVYL